MLFYNRKPFLEKFTKELTIVLPAQEIKPIPPLSPIIAQFGLNAAEVCEKFNKETAEFYPGLPIPTSIFYIPKDKKFDLCFRPIQLKHILEQYVELIPERRKYQITLLDLYRVLIIKSDILHLDTKKQEIYLRNILGTFRSYEYSVEIVFPEEEIIENQENEINLNMEPELIFDLDFDFDFDFKKNTNKAENKITENLKKNENNNDKELQTLEDIILNDIEKEEEEFEEYLDLKFSRKKQLIVKNKYRIKNKIKKKRRDIAFKLWYGLPFSLLIFTPKIRDYHYMKRFLYSLNESIIVRKQRFFYKKNYNIKTTTSHNCYRIYLFDFYRLFEILEQIVEYDVSILGIELHNKVYPIEYFAVALEDIKKNLELFIKSCNEFPKMFDEIFPAFNKMDFEFNGNINLFSNLLWQHITK